MGLLDKLFGRDEPEENNTDLTKANQKTGLYDPSSIERAIAGRPTSIDLSLCRKIPLAEVTALGGAFAQLGPSLQNIVFGNAVGNGSIVRVVFPEGITGRLATLKDTGEAIGGILTNGGGLAQARLKPVGIDPTTVAVMAMATMLVEINQKLDNIQETQLKILSFLELDKQAEQQANIAVLTDILNNYKFNWDNEQYRQNQHMKVLDIKQTSEKNIIFYQEQIAAAIKKVPAINLDQAVKGAISELGKLFSNYRMALYLFAFASFLEVMLLGNFRQEYLDQVANKVQEYDENYQTQFSQTRNMIKKLSAESVETKVMAGIGNAGKALGKLIASSPILSQGPVDEWLQDGGEMLLKGNDEKIAKITALFADEEYIGSNQFVESIRNVSMISNETSEILFDGEALYLAPA